MKICPTCKAKLPDYASVCSKCWTTLEVEKKEERVELAKEDLALDIKREIAKVALPSLFELDTYIKLDSAQKKAVEQLDSKVKASIAQFGDEAPGAEAYLMLGNAALARADHDRAIEYFNLAIKIEPGKKECLHNKGVALYRLGKYMEAERCFDDCLKLDPELAISWYGKGLALLYAGKLRAGMTCYEKAIKLDPGLMKRAKWAAP